MERRDNAAVCVGGKVECLGTDLGGLECLDGVVYDRVRFQMLLEVSCLISGCSLDGVG